MAETLKKALAGAAAHTSSSANDDANHAAHGSFTLQFTDYDIPVASENLVAVAQTAITITAAYWVASVTQGAQATNYVSLALAKGDLANGSQTVFDTITSETAMTVSTKRSFTIVESTDTLAKGDGLYLTVSHNGTTAGVISGTLVVEYKLSN